MIYDFYVDKIKNNKHNKYLEIKPSYPIELTDKEYATIKLCDFKYLNNLYNISETLQNNTLVLKSTQYDYNIVNIGTTTGYMLLSNEFYKSAPNENEYLDDVTSSYNAGIHEIKKQTDPNYIMYYKGASGNNIPNIFDTSTPDDANQSLIFNEVDNEIIIEIVDNSGLKIVREIGWSMHSITASTYISGMTFEILVYASNDNVNYTELTSNSGNEGYIDFPLNENGSEVISNTKIVNNNIPYKYYKIKMKNIYYNEGDPDWDNYVSVMNNFRLAELDFKYIDYTLDYNVGASSEIEYVITDGFYNSTSIINRLNSLFSTRNLVFSLDSYTNKITIQNNNETAYTPSYIVPNLNGMLELRFINENIRNNFGSDLELVQLPNGATSLSNNINLTNFAKLIIACDLNFENKSQNELIIGNTEGTGVPNIIAWINADGIPQSYINYVNYEMIETKISNKHINNIRLIFYNERSQVLYLDNALVHLQIKIYEK